MLFQFLIAGVFGNTFKIALPSCLELVIEGGILAEGLKLWKGLITLVEESKLISGM